MPDSIETQPARGIFRRILRTIAGCAAVSISLLCFPHWLPWMIAFWIGVHTFLVLNDAPGYWPLITCTVILLIRLVFPSPGLIALVVAMLVVTFCRIRGKRGGNIRRIPRWAAPVTLWVLCGYFLTEYRQSASCDQPRVFDPDRPIVCIGDSLTEGMIPDRGYPGQLEELIRAPIINRGASGISSGPAIGILERSLELKPQVVIIEVGGHDFLKWYSRSSTKANLVEMIELCRRHDCEPILMEIPRGFVFDPYACLERELAHEYDLQLIDDRWLRYIVLMSPAAPPGMWMKSRQLSDDGIHSNPRGSRVIARLVANRLAELYGRQVLRSDAGL